jgi:hypothetical protein
MFSQGHIVAGIFGVFSSIGWIIQAAGGGILYKRVSSLRFFALDKLMIGMGLQEWSWGYYVPSCTSPVLIEA